MKTSSCDRPAVAMLAEGLLPPARAAQVRRHLEGCAPCREKYRQFQELAANHRALARVLATASLPERVYPRVSTSVRTGGGGERRSWMRMLAGPAAAMALVALVVLLNRMSSHSSAPRSGLAEREAAGWASPASVVAPEPVDSAHPSVSVYRRAWERSDREFDRVLAAGARTEGMGELFAFRPGAVRVEVEWSAE